MITGRTRVLAILGDPVRHSLSPAIHNAAIRALGLDAVYVALRVPSAGVAAAMASLAAAETAGNVTVPHKGTAYRAVTELTDIARRSGSVNTFWTENGTLHGDNTDVAGLDEAMAHFGTPGPWLLAGTGGSARAVAMVAARRGVALRVRSREPERAVAFAAWAREQEADAVPDDGSTAATLINATPLGLAASDPFPFPVERFGDAPSVLDLVYAPGGTSWVQAARKAGLVAADGREMLLAQGAHAFERFFPGVTAPREVMRATLARALA